MASGSPVAAARKFVQEQTLTYQLNPVIKLWEGHNEPSFGGPDDPNALERMGQYAVFEAERHLPAERPVGDQQPLPAEAGRQRNALERVDVDAGDMQLLDRLPAHRTG